MTESRSPDLDDPNDKTSLQEEVVRLRKIEQAYWSLREALEEGSAAFQGQAEEPRPDAPCQGGAEGFWKPASSEASSGLRDPWEGLWFEQAPAGLALAREDGTVFRVNQEMAQIFGCTPKDLVGRNLFFLGMNAEDRADLMTCLDRDGRVAGKKIVVSLKNGAGLEVIWNIRRPGREKEPLVVVGIPVAPFDQAGKDSAAWERSRQQARTMDALNALAGGLAHDLNNNLGVIFSNCELAVADLGPSHPTRNNLDMALKAAHRARSLIRRVRFHSRAGPDLRPTDMRSLVIEVVGLLRWTLPVTIDIRPMIEVGSSMAMADASQLHQVIMSLAMNAAEAMEPGGGALSLKIENVQVFEPMPAHARTIQPGPYLRLTIADNGTGMDEATLERVFDPFFSTRPHRKGAGLGLWMVHGLVDRHQGAIVLHSVMNEGTTVELFFPRYFGEQTVRKKVEHSFPRGTERIMFVDDEKGMTDTVSRILTLLGYQVTSFRDGAEAWARFCQTPQDFDLVITDQAMPGMSGQELAGKIWQASPNTPVVICTGLSETLAPNGIRNTGVREILVKPVPARELAQSVRRILDQGRCPDQTGKAGVS